MKGLFLVIAGLLALGWSTVFTIQSPYPAEYPGTTTWVEADKVAGKQQVLLADPGAIPKEPVAVEACPSTAPEGATCFTLPLGTAPVAIWAQPETESKAHLVRTVNLIPHYTAVLAGVGTLLFALGLPWALFGSSRGPWAHLLTEKGGGYSLSRFQIGIWFGAAVVGYMGLALPKLAFIVNVPDQIWMLMGVVSASSLVSLGANPGVDASKLLSVQETAPDASAVLAELTAHAKRGQPIPAEVEADVAAAKQKIAAMREGNATLEETGVAFDKARQSLVKLVNSQPFAPPSAKGILDQVAASSNLFSITRTEISSSDTQALADVLLEQLSGAVDAVQQQGYLDEDSAKAVEAARLVIGKAALGAVEAPEYREKVTAAISHLRSVLNTGKGIPTLAGQNADRLQERLKKLDLPGAPTDLIENWQGEGDLTRYQHLFITLMAALLFSVELFRNLDFPEVPQQFLAILGTSQVTYLAGKYYQRLRPLTGGRKGA